MGCGFQAFQRVLALNTDFGQDYNMPQSSSLVKISQVAPIIKFDSLVGWFLGVSTLFGSSKFETIQFSISTQFSTI